MKNAKTVALGFLNYLKEEKLTELLPEIISLLKASSEELVSEAIVTSAAQLDEDDRQIIEKAVQKKFDWQGKIVFEKDPELLGGIKITVGDRVWDLSVKNKMQEIYEQI